MRKSVWAFAVLSLFGMRGMARVEPSENERKKVYEFERTLFVAGSKDFKQRPEAEQRPLVEAFFATLKTAGEKQAFLEMGYTRYVYAINRDVYGECVLKFLKDGDAEIRGAAVGILGSRVGKYANEVEALRDDPDVGVRRAVVVALGRLGRHDLGPWMIKMIQTGKEKEDRLAGLAGVDGLLLSKGGTATERDDYIGALVKLADSSDKEVRLSCIRALGKIDRVEARDALARALDDGDAMVRLESLSGFRAMEGKGLDKAGWVAKALEDGNADVRAAALEALTAMGAEKFVDAVARRLQDQNSRVREASLRALGALKATKLAEAVAGLLKDEDVDVRREALRTLYAIGTRDQAAAVAGAAEDALPDVRYKVINVLQNIDARDQRALLEKMAKDPDAEVATSAKRVLKLWDRK